MKRFLIGFFIIFYCTHVHCATARRTTTTPATPTITAKRTTTNTRATSGARAAKTTATAQKNVAARAATNTRTVKATPTKNTVSARAGATQKVIDSGTKVATATKNTVVNEICLEKYNGCIDSFCMIDNENGGRCVCSDKKQSFDSYLNDIEELNLRSYEMATSGVETLELGTNIDDITEMTNSAIARIDAGKKRSLVDLSMWNQKEEQQNNTYGSSELDGKTGDELYATVHKICEEKIPECTNDMPMLKMMYKKQIDSDCAAYENSLKQQKTKAQQNLDAAQRALRETAKEQFENANKYDLGQCAIKFRECMQTTGGCGDDFSGCATTMATDNTNIRKSTKKSKRYTIQGALSSIEISTSTYDTLVAKKPMCESVTKQCVRVADQVFDTFLRDIAPTIRNAELIAEDKLRQNCVINISNCFQQACKDNIDPNDPDGSYDMCLSRPETMLNVCKIPLEACGINATQESTAQESQIWEFITARLSSMRVDACTTQIKECLQSTDICGKDYTQCIGLDIDSVVAMCPIDKLVACDSSSYLGDQNKKTSYIYNVAQGLLLNIDNKFLEQCQNAVQTKMIEICGSTNNCFPEINEHIGTNSLYTQQKSDGDYLIDGLILFGNINMRPNTDNTTTSTPYIVSYDLNQPDKNSSDYNTHTRIEQTVIADIQNELNRKMSILTSDPTIDMCINGRDMSQISRGSGRDKQRFPNLLIPYANTMFDSLITMAKNNYDLKYANEFSKANSLSEQYKNTLFCNAMIPSNKNKFDVAHVENSGIKEYTDYHVLITGTHNQNLLNAIKQGQQHENIIYVSETVGTEGLASNSKDKFNQVNAAVTRKSEIAREVISAVYEPGPQVCRITKTIYACTGYSAAYNEESESYSVGVEAKVMGSGGSTTVSESESSKTYQGKTCSTYAEPLITEQLINFADNNVIAGQITRSNITSMTINNTTTTNSTSNGWSLSLSADTNTGTSVTNNVKGNMNQTNINTK